MMPIDLFQTPYGGWFSNLPWQINSLMSVMLLLAAYCAYLNLDKKNEAEVVQNSRGA